MATQPIPSTMQAWQFTAAGSGVVKSLKLNSKSSLPNNAESLKPNQTLVQVVAAALNPVDVNLAEIPVVGSFIVPIPSIPGIDFAGRVVKSSQFKPGQMVFGKLGLNPKFGAMAEYAIADNNATALIPDDLDPSDLASMPVVGLTSYQCIVPRIKPGSRVFINGGSGGTGVYGIQIAKAMGCYVATTCSTTNVELCKSLGADQVIDYRTENVVQSLKSGGNFDLVVDNVGHPELYWTAPEYTKPTAQFVTIAAPEGFGAILNLFKIMLWPSFLGGGKRPFKMVQCKDDAQTLERIAQWMKEGKVKPQIEQKYSFQEVPQAYEKIRSGRAKGKLVVQISN